MALRALFCFVFPPASARFRPHLPIPYEKQWPHDATAATHRVI